MLAITIDNPVLLGSVAALSACALVRGDDPTVVETCAGLVRLYRVGNRVLPRSILRRTAACPLDTNRTHYPVGRRHSMGTDSILAISCKSLAGMALAVSTSPDRMFVALIALKVPWTGFYGRHSTAFCSSGGQEVRTVHFARARRGRPAFQRNPLALLRLELMLLQPVTARALRRAQVLAESLDARGFDASAPRSQRHPLQMALWERLTLGFCIPVVGCIVCARILMLLYTSGALYIPELRDLYGFVRDWF